MSKTLQIGKDWTTAKSGRVFFRLKAQSEKVILISMSGQNVIYLSSPKKVKLDIECLKYGVENV